MNNNQLYEQALTLFDSGNYNDSVSILIKLFNCNYNKADIINDLYNCFIFPNTEEFQTNFNQCSPKITNTIKYKDLELDFIPVNDLEFYIYNSKEQSFKGFVNTTHLKNISKNFHSLLFTGHVNIPYFFEIISSSCYATIYLSEIDNLPELLSLLKLPYIQYTNLHRTVILNNAFDFEDYFNNSYAYIPKEIYGSKASEYIELISKIHNKRIANQQNVPKPFLSVCIPSYNRGTFATRAVKLILSTLYDYEVEVIVTNDSSNKDEEAYKELSTLSDCRFRYYDNKTNLGLAGNVRKVLSLARGDYAVVCADEDIIVQENLPAFINTLYRNPDSGVYVTSGFGEEFRLVDPEPYELFPSGILSLNFCLKLNYITGWCLNMNKVDINNIFEKFDALRGNHFLEYFPQIALTMLMSESNSLLNTNIRLWDERFGDNTTYVGNDGSKIFYYVRPESRIMQINGCIELISKNSTLSVDEKGIFFTVLIQGFYKVIFTNMKLLRRLRQEYLWTDFCNILDKNFKKQLELNILGLDHFMKDYVYQHIIDTYNDYSSRTLID